MGEPSASGDRVVPPEDDPEYPSGPWIGYYNYQAGGARCRQELDLTFRKGRLAGEGLDIEIGAFFVRGSYDKGSRKVWWTKAYPGSHSVFYRGFREGKGIWGTWETLVGKGGFMIWPRGLGEGVEAEAEAETEAGAEAAVPAAGAVASTVPAVPQDRS